MADAQNLLLFAGLYLIIPLAIAKGLIGASWAQCGAAFVILWALLLLFGMASGATWGERLGWPLILGMFVSIPGISLLAFVMKRTGALR